MASTDLKGILLGIENPLLDITLYLKDEELLKKYDVQTNNAILAEEKHLPLYDELTSKPEVKYNAGGAAQNSIRLAQWFLPTNSTVYMGCIGEDSYGERLRTCATSDGVTVSYMVCKDSPTGRCAVLVHDKERSLIAHLGAAEKFEKEYLLKPEVTKQWQTAKYYYVGGFFITVSIPSIQLIAEHANENNKVFAMNISAPFIPKFFKEQFNSVLPYIDLLFGNETEALAFAEANNINSKDIGEIALSITKWEKKNNNRKRMVVITQGAKSTLIAYDNKITEYAVPAVPSNEIVDTNGAGDSFVGGFLSQMVQGRDINICVDAGHYASGQIIRVSGIDLTGLTCDKRFL